MKKLIRPGTLVSRRGIAEILGVSKQRVFALEAGTKKKKSDGSFEPVAADPRFPRPLDCIDENEKLPVWRRKDVERYKRQREKR